MSKPQKKPQQSSDVKRMKMLASNSFRKKLKDNIELFRTYRIIVHNDFNSKNLIVGVARNLAEHITVEDTRSSRTKDESIETTFSEIANKPQKL